MDVDSSATPTCTYVPKQLCQAELLKLLLKKWIINCEHKCLNEDNQQKLAREGFGQKEIWEDKMRIDDEKTIQLLESSSIDCKEISFQDGRVCLDGGNGERIEMVSATEFSYINHCSHRWRSLQGSRFQKVVEMLDTSNLMIEIKTRSLYVSGDYRVYLVFKFLDSRKFSSQPTYVNLRYRKGNETLHAYFATWRDDGWMMIELFRTSNHKEADTLYEFLLESFSPCYCGDDAIYVAGIEFRATDNVKDEEIKKLQVLMPNLSMYQVQQLLTSCEEKFWTSTTYEEDEKNIWRREVSGKKHLMFSAKEVLFNFPNEKLFISKPSTHYRFKEVIELLPQQVFYINCTIKRQMLSQDTEYVCYLVFKLPEKRDGLHCPVKVRDLLHEEHKETEIVYFISPKPWNIHVFTRVPKQREDGWMEVNLWKFNSSHKLDNDSVPVNLKLMSYEGSMEGLIICGLDLRPE